MDERMNYLCRRVSGRARRARNPICTSGMETNKTTDNGLKQKNNVKYFNNRLLYLYKYRRLFLFNLIHF